jgi:hypothetical protein
MQRLGEAQFKISPAKKFMRLYFSKQASMVVHICDPSNASGVGKKTMVQVGFEQKCKKLSKNQVK